MKQTLAKRLSMKFAHHLSMEISNFWAQCIADAGNNPRAVLGLLDFPRVSKLVAHLDKSPADFYSIPTESVYDLKNYFDAADEFYDSFGEERKNVTRVYDFQKAKENLWYAYTLNPITYLDWEFAAVYPRMTKVFKLLAKFTVKRRSVATTAWAIVEV